MTVTFVARSRVVPDVTDGVCLSDLHVHHYDAPNLLGYHNKSLRCLGVGVLICCPSILRAANDPRININLVGPSEGLIRKRTPLHIAATHGNAGAARTGAQVHSISHPPLSPSGDIGN